MGAVLAVECERVRSWTSLWLDGELSEVEQALLRAHVGRCAACAGFALDLDGLTRKLRTAPLARPRALGVPVRRAARARTLRVGALAAAVVIAAALGSLAGSLTAHRPGPARSATSTRVTQRRGVVAQLPPSRRMPLPSRSVPV